MNATYLDAVATHGASLITHIGLVDQTGTELSGGSPAYARQPVTWTTPAVGMVRPDADLMFDVPAGKTVAGWSGFSALSGGTDYEGATLTPETYVGQGTYKLLAAGTGISHEAA